MKIDNDFKVGQIVRLKACSFNKYKGHYHLRDKSSYHVLTKKDLERGFYFSSIGAISLKDCELHNWPASAYRLCTPWSGYDQSLFGKVTKPISLKKFNRTTWRSQTPCTTFVYKGDTIIKVEGYFYDMCVYWSGTAGDFYRTKLRTTECGRLLARDMSLLSERKMKMCSRIDEVCS